MFGRARDGARSRAWIAGLVSAAAAAGLGACNASSIEPESVTLPLIESGTQSTEYLTLSGRNLVHLAREARRWVEEGSIDCQTVVSGTLSELGSPKELADLALQVPDAPTGEMALGLITAMVAVVAECDVGTDEFEFSIVVFERRLLQLGVE